VDFIIGNWVYLLLEQALSLLQVFQAVLVGLVPQRPLWWPEELYQIPETESHRLQLEVDGGDVFLLAKSIQFPTKTTQKNLC